MAVRYTGEDDDTGMLIDSRFVTIQLNKDKFFDGNGWRDDAPVLYAYYNGKYQAVSPENFVEINREMLYEAGTVQGFSGGKAYFTIPIKHLGYYRTNNPNRKLNANDKLFDWEKVQSGDFGLVRNHIYTIEVEKIEGLGNGIPRPGDPIVPPTDPEEYFIGARVIVLNWAVVPKQSVNL